MHIFWSKLYDSDILEMTIFYRCDFSFYHVKSISQLTNFWNKKKLGEIVKNIRITKCSFYLNNDRDFANKTNNKLNEQKLNYRPFASFIDQYFAYSNTNKENRLHQHRKMNVSIDSFSFQCKSLCIYSMIYSFICS